MIKIAYIVSTLGRSGPTNQLFNLIKYLVGKNRARCSMFALLGYLWKNKPDTVLVFNRQISMLVGLFRCFSYSNLGLSQEI
jgi:hypothetical protein